MQWVKRSLPQPHRPSSSILRDLAGSPSPTAAGEASARLLPMSCVFAAGRGAGKRSGHAEDDRRSRQARTDHRHRATRNPGRRRASKHPNSTNVPAELPLCAGGPACLSPRPAIVAPSEHWRPVERAERSASQPTTVRT
jgi:hypothetical protein